MIYDDLQELLDNVHVYENSFWCLCPYHSDSRPSMQVWEDSDKPDERKWFRCSGCGVQGNHEKLYRYLTGKGAKPSISIPHKTQQFLPRWKKWSEQFDNIESLVEHAHQNVYTQPDYDWYLKKRKLEPMYKQAKLGYMEGWMFFPILDPQGVVVDVIVRNTHKVGESKYIIHPNNEETPLLYVPNWKRVMSEKIVYIVYGIIDALALEMCELPVITGSTGKSLSSKRLVNLNKKFAIVPDKGEEDAARALAKSLGNFTRILRLDYEDSEKDPDEVRMRRGCDTLKELLMKL